MTAARRHVVLLGTVGLAAFLALALQVGLDTPWPAQWDPAISSWWAGHRQPVLTTVMLGVSAWHSTIGIDVMLAIAVAALAGRRRWRDALWLALAVESSMLLNVAVKLAFARPRPILPAPLVHLETYSFPSGHALASTVLWTCVVLLAPPSLRRAAAVVAAVLVLLVAFSRVYLGAHYVSDVLAGIGEGLACASGCWLLRPAAASHTNAG